VRLLAKARLADLAPVLQTTPDALQDSLMQRGYAVTSAQETLTKLAAAFGAPAESLLFQLLRAL
jgi:hypothetical protein